MILDTLKFNINDFKVLVSFLTTAKITHLTLWRNKVSLMIKNNYYDSISSNEDRKCFRLGKWLFG